MDFLSKGLDGFCSAISQLETPVLFCERFDETSDIWNFIEHKHDCIELLYFLYGNAKVITGDASVQASFYDVVIYPKGMYHTESLQFNHHQEIICLWVDIPGLDIPDVIRIQDEDAKLKGLLESLHAEYKCESPCATLIDYYVKTLAVLIARKCMAKSIQNNMISRVSLYMQDHMAEKITVQRLANLVYVSKSYLSRLFKQQMGISPIEYLQTIRIETAKTILASTNMNTEDISRMVGFQSAKYFYRVFLAYTGMSPREFRKSEAKRSYEIEYSAPVLNGYR